MTGGFASRSRGAAVGDEGVKRREIARPLDCTHRGVASGFLPGPTGKSRSSAPRLDAQGLGSSRSRADASWDSRSRPRSLCCLWECQGGRRGPSVCQSPLLPAPVRGVGTWHSSAGQRRRGAVGGRGTGRSGGRRGWAGGSLHQLRGDAGAKASAPRRRPQGRKPTGRLGAPRAGNRVAGQRPRGDSPHLSGRSHGGRGGGREAEAWESY